MSKFRDKGRRGLFVAAALGALIAVAVAGVAIAGKNKEEACVDTLCIKAGGQFKPKKLSKTKQTPIGLVVEGKISTTDGTQPPALKEVIIETDKNGAVDVKGYPTCKAKQLQSRDTKAAEKACRTRSSAKARRPRRSHSPNSPRSSRTASCWSSTAASRAGRRLS